VVKAFQFLVDASIVMMEYDECFVMIFAPGSSLGLCKNPAKTLWGFLITPGDARGYPYLAPKGAPSFALSASSIMLNSECQNTVHRLIIEFQYITFEYCTQTTINTYLNAAAINAPLLEFRRGVWGEVLHTFVMTFAPGSSLGLCKNPAKTLWGFLITPGDARVGHPD